MNTRMIDDHMQRCCLYVFGKIVKQTFATFVHCKMLMLKMATVRPLKFAMNLTDVVSSFCIDVNNRRLELLFRKCRKKT